MISSRSFFTRILAALAVLISVCYGGARLATAQYSPAGGNTCGGATYPLQVADAAGLNGPVPVLSGGTGVASLEPGIAFVNPGQANDAGTVPGLVLWLPIDYDGGVILGDAGNGVVQVNDQSGNGNNCTQPVNALQLQYEPACLNGLPCIGDGGAADANSCYSTTGPLLAYPYTVITAYKPSAISNANEAVFDTPPNASTQIFHIGSTFYCDVAGTNINLTGHTNGSGLPSISAIQECDFIASTIAQEFFAGGGQFSVAGTSGTAVPDAGYVIGNKWSGGQALTGGLGETIVYNRILTEMEQHAVRSYLAKKWNSH